MEGEKKFSKVIILGSGPAGCAAAIYLGRALIETTIIAGPQPGGQLTITTDVENYPGFKEAVSGPQLMEDMLAQAKRCGANVIYDRIGKVDFQTADQFLLYGANSKYGAQAVIIATGASAKWLGLPTETEFRGAGVSACATCDGFFFKNQDVIVIGGANTAVEEAIYLAGLCRKVTVLYRGDKLRAEAVMVKRLLELTNVEVLYRKELVELMGEDSPKLLKKAKIIDNKTKQISEINCDGCFIAIGHSPNTEIFKGQLELDNQGYIVVDSPFGVKTTKRGIFAAGDVQDKVYRQAITAAASGCMAAMDTMKYLKEN